MLRGTLLGLGILALLGGVACLVAGARRQAVDLLVGGAVLTLGIGLERWRYVRSVNPIRGRWQATPEKFVDPTTGKVVQVYYNAETGERDYRPEGK